jgi:hypothetical protein
MRDHTPESASTAAWLTHEGQPGLTAAQRPSGGRAVLVAAAAVVVAALTWTTSLHAAALVKNAHHHEGTETSQRNRANVVTRKVQSSATGLLERWAHCERGNGDTNQAEPTVEHQVIYIAVAMTPGSSLGPQSASDPCSGYLTAAQEAVAGGQPVDGWGDDALYVQYANCMRANGYPTFPYPSGIEPDGHSRTNFNGTGIDPNSPTFLNGSANQTCGEHVGAPAWWINNWGPPGSLDVYPAGTDPNQPLLPQLKGLRPPGWPRSNDRPTATPVQLPLAPRPQSTGHGA